VQAQAHHVFQHQQQQQPAPAANGPRFDTNNQIPSVPPQFPPHLFPPPPNLSSDFFKQFANAGFPPPPPPPNLHPLPIPNPQYSTTLHAAMNTPAAPSYPLPHTPGQQGFASGFNQNEQAQQHGTFQYTGGQPSSQGKTDWQRDNQGYNITTAGPNKSSANTRPLSRGITNVSSDKGMDATFSLSPS
jgi:hypothetical protein